MNISVLISVYKNDNPSFFEQALYSVSVSQSYKPKQIVVVFDGPVDENIEHVIDKIKSQCLEIEFTVIRNEYNAGLAHALNCGLKECKYEWIARMDSDDISLPDRFMKQVEYISTNPSISVLGGYISEFEDDPNHLISLRKVGLTNEEIIKSSRTRTPMNHVTVMYKKIDVIKVGGYSEDFGKLEDYKLWIDLITNGFILANINEVLVYVRIGNGFISRRSNKREIKDWDMLQKYLLKAKLINKFKSFKNRIYIRAFIYMPKWLKVLAYKMFLRKSIK